MRIVIAGATGLVGGLLLNRLEGHLLTLVGRRLAPNAPSGAVQRIGPISDWPDLIGQSPCDAAICCLGTTIRAAGSKQAFAAVDHTAVSAFAMAAKASGARHFLMISSVGANPNSGNFYLRTKGKAEAAVQETGFERLDIFRPGLLRGNRKGAYRPGEALMMAISPMTDLLTPHVFDQYRSIAAQRVADAMAACVGREDGGMRILENRDMLRMAGIR